MPKKPQVDPLLAHCRSLPGATEDVKWSDHLVFSVGGKMFAIFSLPELDTLSLKVDAAVLAILTETPGIIPAPYLARHGWVKVEDRQALPEAAIEELLTAAHDLVRSKLPRRVRERVGG